MTSSNYTEAGGKELRYYQQLAINRVIEAVSTKLGQDHVLSAAVSTANESSRRSRNRAALGHCGHPAVGQRRGREKKGVGRALGRRYPGSFW